MNIESKDLLPFTVVFFFCASSLRQHLLLDKVLLITQNVLVTKFQTIVPTFAFWTQI